MNAELVGFRGGHHDPRCIDLPDVDTARPEAFESTNLDRIPSHRYGAETNTTNSRQSTDG